MGTPSSHEIQSSLEAGKGSKAVLLMSTALEPRFLDTGSALSLPPHLKQGIRLEWTRGSDGNEAELSHCLQAHRNRADLPQGHSCQRRQVSPHNTLTAWSLGLLLTRIVSGGLQGL